MKRFFIPISILSLLVSCDSAQEEAVIAEENRSQADSVVVQVDTLPRVTGVGGIFFYSDDPAKTNEWYTKNLGIEINDWGSSSFDSRDLNNPDQINSLQWKAFQNGDEYFAPSSKDFMINYQVQHIEALINKLKENGVVLIDSLETYDYGKFIHIMDSDGNKIELWEPM